MYGPEYLMGNRERIEINLGNGYFLTAERNPDPAYDKEIFIGIEKESTGNNIWHQDLVVVRPSYTYRDENDNWLDSPRWSEDEFEVLVYGDENSEDWTQNYMIGLYEDEQRTEFAI